MQHMGCEIFISVPGITGMRALPGIGAGQDVFFILNADFDSCFLLVSPTMLFSPGFACESRRK